MQGFLADDDAGDTVGDGRDGWGRRDSVLRGGVLVAGEGLLFV